MNQENIYLAVGKTLRDLQEPLHLKAKILFKLNYHNIRFEKRYRNISFMGWPLMVIDTKKPLHFLTS